VREWDVFQIAVGTQIDPCDSKPLTSETADATGSDPGFPDVDLTFDAWDMTGCKYTHKDENTIGTMTCPGVSKITCSDIRNETFVGCEGGGNVYASLFCEW
jgi:hypothetical protein